MTSPSPLTRRPQAAAFSIEDLLERVRRGEVRVPKFQRPFRWDAQDIRALLDSIYRGYPIGTLLFWKKEAPAASVSFGPVRLDAPHISQALWTVDGQQRITALTGVLLHPPYSQDSAPDDFILHFDLEKEEFLHPGMKAQPPPHFLPMNVVVDSELLLGWLDRYPGRAEHPEHVRTAQRLSKAIREYPVQAHIVEADEERTLRIIFERLNSRGKSLQEAEIFNALHGHAQQARPTDLHALSRNLVPLGFGTLREPWLLKAVLAVRGLDITRDFRQQLSKDSDLTEALSQAELALRDVIVFIKRDAGISHVELLPYTLPLMLLARFFHLHPEPSARSRELLERWLWRGALTARHREEDIPFVHESLASIGADEERSVQNLLSLVPRNVTTSNLRPLDPSHHFDLPLVKLQVNALLALHPRHLLTGERVDAAALLHQRGNHVLRPAYPSLRGEFARSIANYFFHPPTGKSLLKLLKASPSLGTDILLSHGITPEAFTALLRDKPSDFLQTRKLFLDAHAFEYFETRARWGESDRQSLQSLIVPDEED